MTRKQDVLRAAMKSAETFAYYCAIQKALRLHRKINPWLHGMTILRAPQGQLAEPYREAAEAVLFAGRRPAYNEMERRVIVDDDNSAFRKGLDSDDVRSFGYVLVVVVHDFKIPPEWQLAASFIGDIEKLTVRQVRSALLNCCDVVAADTQIAEALNIGADLMWRAVARGRSFNESLRRLRSLGASDSAPAKRKSQPNERGLEDMAGYGQAAEWGMQLAEDLRDWQAGKIGWCDVDRGVLLEGKPGTGKTTFARALATTANAHLVTASLAAWQRRGHLGDLLKAMHRDFEQAKSKSPTILFIDEIDAFGDREKLDDDNRDYSIQVVNALLEEIDGSDEHEGLIIVGACNNASRIDSALRRPGRLDRFIQIPLPGPAERLLILAQYLDQALTQSQLAPVSDLSDGMSGAHLEQLARDARRSARRSGRPVSVDDVLAHLPPRVIIPSEHRRAMAVHEIGHSLVGLKLGAGKFVGVKIADWFNPGDRVIELGGAHFKQSVLQRRDRDYFERENAMLLGGIAAEIVILGGHCDGGGLIVGSDLQRATDRLTEMEAATGLGHRLTFSAAADADEADRVRRFYPRLAEAVEEGLLRQLERAKAIIVEERVLFDAMCDALVEKGRLDAQQVGEMVAAHAVSFQTVPVVLEPDSYSGIAAQ